MFVAVRAQSHKSLTEADFCEFNCNIKHTCLILLFSDFMFSLIPSSAYVNVHTNHRNISNLGQIRPEDLHSKQNWKRCVWRSLNSTPPTTKNNIPQTYVYWQSLGTFLWSFYLKWKYLFFNKINSCWHIFNKGLNFPLDL